MFCIVAFIVLAILGIFSATHRALAREAFACVLRRVTLRPCTADFRDKVQGVIVGKLLQRSVFAARIVNRHAELLSWIFLLLTLASTIWFARGVYNYYLYGNCNGEHASGFCLFDPAGGNNKISPVAQGCSVNQPHEEALQLTGVDLNLFPTKNAGAKDTIVFIGCYSCDYTRKAYPVMKELIRRTGAQLTFAHFAAMPETAYLSKYDACAYEQDHEKFWTFNDALFSIDKAQMTDVGVIEARAADAGLDVGALRQCVSDPAIEEIVRREETQIRATGIYGTPTVFINGKALVGPKPYRVYARALR